MTTTSNDRPRRHLVASTTWQAGVSKSFEVVEGFLAFGGPTGNDISVRRRIVELAQGRQHTENHLLVCNPTSPEASTEVGIDASKAQELLALRQGGLLEYTTHVVVRSGAVFAIDVYRGALEGLVVATGDPGVGDTPDWLGADVTDNPSLDHVALARAGTPSIPAPRM